MLSQRPQFVRSSTLKGCVIALQGVDEDWDHGTSLGGIDLRDRRSRKQPQKGVLAFVLGER